MRERVSMALIGASLGLVVVLAAVPVFAQSSSSNYRVEETFFGTGGELDASSANYKARQSAGELTVGNSASGSYQFNAGFNTTDEPLLEFAVNGGTYDLGILDASAAGTAVATFTVRNYLSSGYIVIINGAAPSLVGGSHTLTPMASAVGSVPGTEQFGVNLVDNSNPNIGANPVQTPDNTFSFGNALTGYDTANLFKFADGDTIAFSPKSSGQTNYSLSIIANVTRDTPAGQYGGHLNLQVVPTF